MVIYFKSILEITGRRKVDCRCIKQWNCEKLEIYFKWVSIFIMGYEQNTFAGQIRNCLWSELNFGWLIANSFIKKEHYTFSLTNIWINCNILLYPLVTQKNDWSNNLIWKVGYISMFRFHILVPSSTNYLYNELHWGFWSVYPVISVDYSNGISVE